MQPAAAQASSPSALHPTFTDVQSELNRIAKFQEDGVLELATVSGQVFTLFFRLGRLVWATDQECRFRRWNRLLGRFFPAIAPQIRRLQAKEVDIFWEYKLLSRLLHQGKLEREIINTLIGENIREILFDISQDAGAITGLNLKSDRTLTISNPISLLSVSELMDDAVQDIEGWIDAGLQSCSPNWSPVICSYEALQTAVSGKTYEVMTNLIKGELSLRDLALLLPGDLLSTSKTLCQYEQNQILEFRTLQDFPPPWPVQQPSNTAVQSTVDAPLILCVDDSPRNCEELGRIIRDSGYRYISLEDSVQALPTIIEHRPALLFIDLVMPIINGYELCSKIRQISMFRDTPIIILTSNDGVVDRIRSKMTGATEFLSKPARSNEILTTLCRYLPLPD